LATFTYGGPTKLDLDTQLRAALMRSNGDTVQAAYLFVRWCEADSEIAALLPDVVTDYVERHMKKLAKEIKR
jgi:hypothetical protein